jgi:F420-non-reducing hydrogenase large subunit
MLRELMYLGHYIHSHSLHFFALGGPDLILGIDSPMETRNLLGIIAADPETAKKALRLRSIGQIITETIGGRGTHPVTCVAGGITFTLTPEKREMLKGLCAEALELSKVTMGLAKTIIDKNWEALKDLALETYYVGNTLNGKVNFVEGKIKAIDPKGNPAAEFDVNDYEKYLQEKVFPFSYMKPVYFKHNGADNIYRVGTLARLNVADGFETPLAEAEFQEFRSRFAKPAHNTVLLHYARVIELLHAAEKAVQYINDDRITGETRVPVSKKAGRGVGFVEAPRGVLIHDYTGDENGRLTKCNLIVATQENYAAINETIKQAAVSFIEKSDKQVLNGVEVSIRCYDPCLSCATHAVGKMPLEVNFIQGGKIIRTVRRGK